MDKIKTLLKEPAFRRTLGYYWLLLCLGLAAGALGPLLPTLAEQTRVDVGSMGRLFLFSAGAGTLGTLIGGRLFDRFRGHTVLGLAAIGSGLLLLTFPFMPSLAWLLAAATVRGVLDGIINNGINTLLVWTHRDKVTPYMNALHFFFGLGAFLAPLAVAQVVDIPGAYRWVYVALAAFTVLAGLRMATLAGSPHPADKVETAAGTAPARTVPWSVALITMAYLFFYVGAEISFGNWVFTYAVELKLASAVQAAYLNSGFWLTFTIGRLLGVSLATRFAPRQIITAALAGMIICMGLVAVFSGSLGILWLATLAIGFCMAPVYATGLSLAVQGLKLTARASSVILMGDSLGGMVLPWLVGLVLGATGPRAMVYLVLGTTICDLLVFAGLLRARAAALRS